MLKNYFFVKNYIFVKNLILSTLLSLLYRPLFFVLLQLNLKWKIVTMKLKKYIFVSFVNTVPAEQEHWSLGEVAGPEIQGVLLNMRIQIPSMFNHLYKLYIS